MSAPNEPLLAEPKCSFCGKSQSNVRKLVAGPNDNFICDECVYLSLRVVSREGFNLRAAYVGFELIAKLLYPVGLILDRIIK
ncbi:hypothetical protein IMX07_06725 [bacterium]|nr:hypothetical protein [bacterium]